MAGPLLRLSMRNWMPVASIARPIAPPRASISRTICPLPTPPMAGLQLIWAIVSRLLVNSAVLAPNPCRGQRRLDPGMAAADHQNVEIVGGAHTMTLSQFTDRCKAAIDSGALLPKQALHARSGEEC